MTDERGRMSIDHGALRLPPPFPAPPRAPGAPPDAAAEPAAPWGAMGIAYGPFRSEAGLSLAARVRVADGMRWDSGESKFAVGWFAESNPRDPLAGGCAVHLVKCADGLRGALAVCGPAGSLVVPSLMQLDLQITSVVRSGQALFPVSSAAGIPDVPAYPAMQLLGTALLPGDELYAGFHQRHQRDDLHATRLDGFRVAALDRPGRFEPHWPCLPIPAPLRLGTPYQRAGTRVVVGEDFRGAGHLAGKATTTGERVWERVGGPGSETIHLMPEGGARTTVENSHFISYTVPWDNPRFADVSYELTPPAEPVEGHAGLVLSQDERNVLLLGWDTPANYIGLWCTMGGRWVAVDLVVAHIPSGAPHTLRVSCDGDNYSLWMNDEPIIMARISDTFPERHGIRINRVGIGLTRFRGRGDQGTLWRTFVGRR